MTGENKLYFASLFELRTDTFENGTKIVPSNFKLYRVIRVKYLDHSLACLICIMRLQSNLCDK